MSGRLKRLFTAEFLIVAAVIFVAIFFAKFPTLYNWLNTPKGYWYPKQTSWYDAWDTNDQVSAIRYGQRKGLAFVNTYTTIEHKPTIFYQYYTFLGILNRLFKIDPFILYHLATIISSIILIMACYLIAKLFFSDIVFRLGAFIVMVLGGGLGWIPQLSSADVKLAGFTTINAFERGHDAFSTAFFLLSFLFIFQFFQSPKTRYIVLAIISGFINITFHPPFAVLYITSGLMISILYFRYQKRKDLIVYPLAILVLFVVYYILSLSSLLNNPGFTGTVEQSLFTVDSFLLAFGFGLLSLFILWELVNEIKQDLKLSVLKIIFLTQFALLISPFGFHLYFAKGLHVWGVILGFIGITSLISQKRIQLVTITLIISLSLLPRLLIFYSLMNVPVNNSFFFLPKSEGEAITFMSTLPTDSAVLSLYRIGNYIPAHTDNKVYYGHKYQTPNGAETLRKAQIFYTAMKEEEQKKFLQDNHIDYIYYGLEEAELRKDNNLTLQNPFAHFPVLYSNDAAIVYEVDKNTSK